ncbi:MAG: hypothetical protein AAF830_16590 [Pseudomonadota bacterium]
MTSTLFLSGYVTAFAEEGEELRRRCGVLTRKGGLRADAADIFEKIEGRGEVVACLPFSAVTSQVLRVSAPIGRVVSHTDIADALEAASAKAGGDDLALVSAEPSRVLLDGHVTEGSPVGRPAQIMDVDVTAFVSPLRFLAKLEEACSQGGMTLAGVMAPEEAFAASITDDPAEEIVMIVCDRWHTKVMRLVAGHVDLSCTVDIGPGHLADDLAVTLKLEPTKAEEIARRLVLGNGHHDEAAMAPVVMARLEEWAAAVAKAAEAAGLLLSEAHLVGLPAAPLVSGALANHGIGALSPDPHLRRTDPAVYALVDGARNRAAGALPRSQAAALHLEAPHKVKGPLDWLRRNF